MIHRKGKRKKKKKVDEMEVNTIYEEILNFKKWENLCVRLLILGTILVAHPRTNFGYRFQK